MIQTLEEKKCSKCKLILPVEEFYSGEHYCRKCHREYMNKRNQTPKKKAYMKDWRKSQKGKSFMKARRRTLMHNDSSFAIRCLLSTQLHHKLKSYSERGKTKTSLGYGINYNKICEYLKPTVNKRKANHVDHIIPASYFDLNDKIQIRLCFSTENLQWLLELENFSKGATIRQEDLIELKRRIIEDSDKLDVNILKQLFQLGIDKCQISEKFNNLILIK